MTGPTLRLALLASLAGGGLAGCGAIYRSPSVGGNDSQVRVIDLTPETVLLANRDAFQPRTLPAFFSQTAGAGGVPGGSVLPEPVSGGDPEALSGGTRLPPAADPGPYRIGVGDVLALSLPVGGAPDPATAQRERTFTVQDDGAIAVPELGRVPLAGLTLPEAEAELFQSLVENQIDPTFSIEVAEFNAGQVSVGGAVRNPGVVAVSLSPLYLEGALAQAGGATVADRDEAMVRLYRDGQLYQIPLDDLLASSGRIRLLPGDSVFVDASLDLQQAQDFFAEQIQVAQLRQSARQAALQELNVTVSLERARLADARDSFESQLELGAIERDYVYLTGEVEDQGRFPLPFGQTATLADALYAEGNGIPTQTGNVGEIYVLRGSSDPREFGAMTAWHLDASNAANLILATRLELRPDDVIFVAEQPVTRWNRVIQQITPSLIQTTVAAAGN